MAIRVDPPVNAYQEAEAPCVGLLLLRHPGFFQQAISPLAASRPVNAYSGLATIEVRSGREKWFNHDRFGRLSEIAGAFGFIRPFDPINAANMPTGSESVLRTTETRAGIFSYYYDAQNRRTRKEYPTGEIDEFVWGPSKELLMETAPYELGKGPDGAYSVEEYIHLGGRPVLRVWIGC